MAGEKGSALILTIIIFSVIMILGAVILQIAVSETRFTTYEENRIKAYYIARAGAEAVGAYIADRLHSKSAIEALLQKNKSPTDFGGGKFEVDFPLNNVYAPTIRSTGTYGNVSQTVTLAMKKKYYFDAALTITGNLTGDQIQNNHMIYGNVQIHNSKYNALKDQLNLQNGEPVSTDKSPECPTNPCYPAYSVRDWIISNGTISASDNHNMHSFNSISIPNNTRVTFDTSNGDIKLYTDIFSVGNGTNTVVTVSGSNNLYIYVGSLMNFLQTLVTTNGAKVYILMLNGSTAHFQTGNTAFEGAIIAPGAVVEMKSTLINGPVVAGALKIGSGTNIKFDAKTGNGNLYPEDLGMSSLGYSKLVWGN